MRQDDHILTLLDQGVSTTLIVAKHGYKLATVLDLATRRERARQGITTKQRPKKSAS